MLTGLKLRATMIHPVSVIVAATDPDDNRFLECAVDGGAAYLITGNLKDYPPRWGNIAMVNARQFLEGSGQ